MHLMASCVKLRLLFGARPTVWVESGSLSLLSQMANQHCLYGSMKEFQGTCPVIFSNSGKAHERNEKIQYLFSSRIWPVHVLFLALYKQILKPLNKFYMETYTGRGHVSTL